MSRMTWSNVIYRYTEANLSSTATNRKLPIFDISHTLFLDNKNPKLLSKNKKNPKPYDVTISKVDKKKQDIILTWSQTK